MREIHCSEHTLLSVQMKLRHFVLTTTLFLNAIKSYFINLIHSVHKLYCSRDAVWKNTDGRRPCKMADEQLLLVQGLLTLWTVLTASEILLTILDCQKPESYTHLGIHSAFKNNQVTS